MKNIVTITIFALCNVVLSYAQSYNPSIISKLQQREKGQGEVQVVQDKRIGMMMVKASEVNASRGTIRGFRIRIFSDHSSDARKLAYDAKSKFMTNFPDIETYFDIKAPDWKMYVGNFRTITDAVRAKKQVEKFFKDAFIVEADIDINKI